jgi:hypothetical protein
VENGGSVEPPLQKREKPIMPKRKVSHSNIPSGDPTPPNGPMPEPDLASFSVRPPAPSPSIEQEFDLNAFRVDPGPIAMPVESSIDAVRVEKPRRMEFVFVHPDWRDYIWIIPGDFKGKWEAHLVAPKIAVAYPQVCRKVLVVPYADVNGNYYLWPIPQEDAAGRINEYNRSAMRRVVQAAGRWCQFEANLGNHTYNLYEAVDQREAPQWPPEGITFLIKKAFEDRLVTTADHPIFRTVCGRKV